MSSSIEILTNTSIYLYRYVATSLYILGNLGNFLSLLVFVQRSWRKNVCVFYFLICGLTSILNINVSMLQSILSIAFKINPQNNNFVWCKLYYYIPYFTSIFYPITLILASFDRLLISSQNVNTRLYSSKRLAYFSLSIATFVCTLFCMHILIKINLQQYGPFIVVCQLDFSPSYINFFLYSTLVISTAMLVTLIVLSIIAFQNVRRIRAVPRQQRNQLRTMNKKDFQLLRCLYVHNIVYILSSILIVVSVGYSSTVNPLTASPMQVAISDTLSNFGGFLHYIPYCANFIIFISVSKAFRMAHKRMIYRICRKDLTTVREEENNPHEVAIRDNIELNNNAVSMIVLQA